jgi:hypothetical protein
MVLSIFFCVGVKNMRNLFKRVITGFLLVLTVFYMFSQGLVIESFAKDDPYTALAKATTKYNGVDYSSEYNPLFYYLNYEDLRKAYGTDANKLIEHYVIFGKKEKRVANRLIGDSVDYVVPTGKEAVVVVPKTTHDNGGMTYGQEVQARSIAKQIADSINARVAALDAAADAEAAEKAAEEAAKQAEKGDDSKKKSSSKKSSKKDEVKHVTEIEKVAYAAGVVKAYCDLGTYTTEGKIYRTAYGVFIGREYSCAGSTRALGLVLDYMGITWYHKNINTWADQWCQVIVDNQEGYADPMISSAGYGKHPNEGGSSKDAVSYASVRERFDVKTSILR